MVLEKFSDSLRRTFRKIARLTILDKEAVESILRDIQRTLLQADVDVLLVAELSKKIKKKLFEKELPKGMTLKEYFIQTLYEEIVSILGKESETLELKPQKILLIGLFGSGKTTTAGKLAKWFQVRGLKPALVACDTHRPAAQDQLQQIGNALGVPVYREGKNPKEIAKKAIENSKESVLIFDSAGRDALDSTLAKELKDLEKTINPDEVLLIIPADLGQAARKQTEGFSKLVGITGIIITKLDGTARGGGALSAARVSGAKVKFIGTGEKLEDFEAYDPQRFVSRMIGYGDLQGLLEKVKEIGMDEKKAKEILEGRFGLEEFIQQVSQFEKIGSLSRIIDMIPGFGMKIPEDVLGVQEEKMKKWKHILNSMTPEERKNPEILNASRIKRIAKGSGTKEEEVRELLKNYKQVKKFIKITKGGKAFKRGPFARLAKQIGFYKI